MPSSPPTPTRRRTSSSTAGHLSSPSASPQSIDPSPKRPFSNQRSSQYSLASPSTPRALHSHDRSGYFESSNGSDDLINSSSAISLGNLADELADAFDEEEEEEEGEEDNDEEHGHGETASGSLYDRAEGIRHGQLKENVHPISSNGVANGPAIPISPVRQDISDLTLSPLKQFSRPRHSRKTSQYDRSDSGDDSDLEVSHCPVLEARLADVGSLARQDTHVSGSDADEIVQRLADSLKDLGSQAGVENAATRLIAAHTALITHVSHQTRTLLTLTHPLVSPLSTPPNSEVIDDLLPVLTSLVRALPTTTSHTLPSLHNMHSSTSDLISVLTYLSDTLHVMRQTTALASRRLRVARELVIEMRREAEAGETGIRWVEKGNWECRLAGRDCARVCGEVVGGFEQVCASWRKRLAGGMTGVEVGVA